MGRRRRDFDEFEDATREPSPGRSGGGWIAALVIIAYVVLRVLGGSAKSTTTSRTKLSPLRGS